jgi:hypothetical protein
MWKVCFTFDTCILLQIVVFISPGRNVCSEVSEIAVNVLTVAENILLGV